MHPVFILALLCVCICVLVYLCFCTLTSPQPSSEARSLVIVLPFLKCDFVDEFIYLQPLLKIAQGSMPEPHNTNSTHLKQMSRFLGASHLLPKRKTHKMKLGDHSLNFLLARPGGVSRDLL